MIADDESITYCIILAISIQHLVAPYLRYVLQLESWIASYCCCSGIVYCVHHSQLETFWCDELHLSKNFKNDKVSQTAALLKEDRTYTES